MKENKNIERLFQEKFKDFEVSHARFCLGKHSREITSKREKKKSYSVLV